MQWLIPRGNKINVPLLTPLQCGHTKSGGSWSTSIAGDVGVRQNGDALALVAADVGDTIGGVGGGGVGVSGETTAT